jgi:hypothetical protein
LTELDLNWRKSGVSLSVVPPAPPETAAEKSLSAKNGVSVWWAFYSSFLGYYFYSRFYYFGSIIILVSPLP